MGTRALLSALRPSPFGLRPSSWTAGTYSPRASAGLGPGLSPWRLFLGWLGLAPGVFQLPSS